MPRFTTSDGLSLYYEDDGSGPPILCLAGLTRNSADFSWLAPHLSAYRLIRMDYRGRGKSDYDKDFMNYNILCEGHDTIELLDHLNIPCTTLIGTSRGGLIAMALSLTNPERLNGVVLNDIGPEVTPGGIARIMDYVGKEPGFADVAAATDALKASQDAEFPGVPLSRWQEQAAAIWDEKPEGGVGIRYDPRLRDALIKQAEAGNMPDLWSLFDELKTLPLAAIRGANSDLLSVETFAKMQVRNPNIIATTVPNRGHIPFLDEAEALAAIHTLLENIT